MGTVTATSGGGGEKYVRVLNHRGGALRDWEPMDLRYVGHVGEVLQNGGGKLSIVCGDPGEEMRKPRGQEPPPCHPEENNPKK
jgi:hypothetical protein